MHNMSRYSFSINNLISSNFGIRLCALICLITIWSTTFISLNWGLIDIRVYADLVVSCTTVQPPVTYAAQRNQLQHLQHSATLCNTCSTVQSSATPKAQCNQLQHLQHSATRCNTCSTVQPSATPRHSATSCNTCSTVQPAATPAAQYN